MDCTLHSLLVDVYVFSTVTTIKNIYKDQDDCGVYVEYYDVKHSLMKLEASNMHDRSHYKKQRGEYMSLT